MTDPDRIRPAATVVLLRREADGVRVLMGQRAAKAVFLASKFVFPGGAVDPDDGEVPLARPLPDTCARRLPDAAGASPAAFAAAAIRELYEETGLALARPGQWPTPPSAPGAGTAWADLARRGLLPDAGALRLVFRAITPPGRPRRFDACFFLADASALHGDPEDFSRAGPELSHLRWLPLAEARALDLPFVTALMLAEIADLARMPSGQPPQRVGFVDNHTNAPKFRWLE